MSCPCSLIAVGWSLVVDFMSWTGGIHSVIHNYSQCTCGSGCNSQLPVSVFLAVQMLWSEQL